MTSTVVPAPLRDERGTRPPRVSQEAGRTVIWLEGEQDSVTVSVLRTLLAGAAAGNDGDVVVDLGQVTFIDASIVGALVRGQNLLRPAGRELVLREPPPFIGRVIEICGLGLLQ